MRFKLEMRADDLMQKLAERAQKLSFKDLEY
jgi:hypothetical protein